MRMILSTLFTTLMLSSFFALPVLAQERFLPLHSESELENTLSFSGAAPNSNESEISKIKSAKYISFANSPDDHFRFVIETEKDSTKSTRHITLGKTAHNILLRKALLQKLGYPMPALTFLPEIEINFEDRTSKKIFLSKLEQRTGSDPKRWIKEENKEQVILQDVVISEVHNDDQDLAFGSLTPDQISQNFNLNALIIPYTLTHVPESINILSWISGTIYNEGVKVDYPNSDVFNPTGLDIQVILKKIATLTRKDWVEIAAFARLPIEVESLLVEKLISRRNSFMELFSVNSTPLDFDPKITLLPNLFQGQVTKKEWEGYASHFSLGSPESPLNPGEITAFTKCLHVFAYPK